MATDEIILKLRVEDGQLKEATAKIDKQSKAIDKNTKKKKEATNATNRHNKAEKALYQSNLSSAKSFSKMNQTMGGSSGVVAAYATLAANVFALTAAFGALSRAAQVTQLEKGLELMGAQSGRTLSIMSKGLREVTDNAISAEQAMRGAAMGISGGFGGAELEGLAKIAKGASVALGRDMADAFDRLTRGAIKLEPEILDELGIMVRVDEAAENYAATIGKTASQLTQFEKRQAFMNAILEQGELKFGDIAEQVDPDPYARLAATFADLTKNIFQFINIGLGPVVGFLANNMSVLAGVTIMFASTIAGKMLPFLGQAGSNAFAAAEKMRELSDETRDFAKAGVKAAKSDLGKTGLGGKVFKDIAEKAKDGTLSIKDQEDAQKSLQKSLEAYQSKSRMGAKLNSAENKARIAGIKKEQANLQVLITQKKIQQKLDERALVLAARANLAQRSGAAIQGFTLGVQGFGEAWSSINAATGDYTKELTKIAKEGLKAGETLGDNAKRTIAFKGAIEGAKNQARLLGAAFLKALPWIGALVVVMGTGYAIYKKFFETDTMREYKKSLKDIETIQEGLPDKVKEYNKAINATTNLAENQVKQWTILSGVLTEISGILKTDIRLMKELAAEGDLGDAGNLVFGDLTNLGKMQTSDVAAARTMGANFLKDAFPEWNPVDEIANNITGALGTIKDSGSVQALTMLLDSEFEGVAESMERNLKEAINPKNFEEGTFTGTGLEFLVEVLAPAIGKTRAEFEQMGPAADGLLKSLKESERASATFVATLGQKTSVDALALSVNSTSKAISDLEVAMKNAGKEGDKSALGRLLLGVGGTEAQMLGKDFVRIQDRAKQATAAVTKAESEGEVIFEGQKVSLQEMIEIRDKALAQLGLMTPEYETHTELVNEIQVQERKIKTTLDAIGKQQTLVNKLAKTNVALAGKGSKLELAKLKANRDLLKNQQKLKVATKATALVTERAGIGNLTIEYKKQADLSDYIGLTQQQQQQFRDQTRLTENEITDAIASQYKLELAQIEVNRVLLSQTAQMGLDRNNALQQTLDLQNKINKTVEDRRIVEQKLSKFMREGSTDLNAGEQAMNKIKAAKIEFEQAMSKAKVEKAILDYKAKLQKVDIIIANQQIAAFNKTVKKEDRLELIDAAAVGLVIDENTKLAKDAINENINLLASTFKLAIAEGYSAIRESITSGEMSTGEGLTMTTELNTLMGTGPYKERLNEAKGELDTILENFTKQWKPGMMMDESTAGMVTALMKEIETLEESNDAFGASMDTRREKIETLKNASAGFIEEFKKISPEGEAYAGALTGMLGMADGFSMIADAADDSAKRIEGIQHTMQAVTQVMSSISRARVSAIDSEIKAEEARDGKSKKSIEKIKMLKKKKYEMEKKAFEQNKKLGIANALINTYEGVTAALKEGGAGWPMAAAIMAMGLMQVAMISKTQFAGAAPEGGGVGTPPSIEVGKRSNKVDVSQRATAGELAYLRNARGVGTNANNFQAIGGAAGLRKGYATGGEILVGEQGPEVIKPTAEGYNIVPNDQLGGKPVNAHFTINAIDAQGVEEVLMGQQGNIISMIRSAANDYGEEFLETVNTDVYGSPKSGGGIDY